MTTAITEQLHVPVNLRGAVPGTFAVPFGKPPTKASDSPALCVEMGGVTLCAREKIPPGVPMLIRVN